MSPSVAWLQEIWREACRNIEIAEATDRIARIVARRLPVAGLVVRHLQEDRRLLTTVGTGPGRTKDLGPDARSKLSVDDLARLMAWLTAGQAGHRPRAGRPAPDIDCLVPPGLDGDLVLLPLANGHRTRGLLVAVLADGQAADSTVTEKLALLREPMATALENDRRLRELSERSEAAEADRKALLQKLRRPDLSAPIIGSTGGLRGVMERVALVAASDVPILILGETGSGKEVIAREIHGQSPQARGPFIRVNCGAIPSELVDSELFGHEKGSFTGATATRRGWFEQADGGTLLLDEIGDLPPHAQVRLLRVLQEGSIQRVGGEQMVRVDVRVVAATHRDLPTMVREGTFREDLWYRLAVFPVLLPPLRDRLEDIPPLVDLLARRAAERFGLMPQPPDPTDLMLLLAYGWPGNVRELASVIDRAVILGMGRRLEVRQALGLTPQTGNAGTSLPAAGAAPENVNEFLSLDAATARHIRSALTISAGRVEGPNGAAALLAINPHTLRARMRKLGVDWANFRRPDKP